METARKISIFGHDIRIKRLKVFNFRGFPNLNDLEFKDDLTVIIAPNGGGKTTILDAIAACLRNYIFQLTKSEEASQYEWNYFDLKNGTEVGAINLESTLKYEYEEYLSDEEDENDDKKYEEIFPASVRSYKDSIEKNINLRLDINKTSIRHKIDGYISDIHSNFDYGISSSNEMNIQYQRVPVLLYYGSEKNKPANIEESAWVIKSNMLQVFADCLTPKRFDYKSFVRWFETIYKIASFSEEEARYEKKILKLMQTIIEKSLNKINNHENYYQKLRMKYTIEHDFIVIDKKDNENKYSYIAFEQLSAGEKIIISLLADITRRMIIANPSIIDEIPNEFLNEDVILNPHEILRGQGVVLIDEIDLHLHPKWQRVIIPLLISLFPNIQFVITTHSPLVVQSTSRQSRIKIDNGNLVLFDGEYKEDYQETMIDSFDINSFLDIETANQLERLRQKIESIIEGDIDQKNNEFIDLVRILSQKGETVKSILAFELTQLKIKMAYYDKNK